MNLPALMRTPPDNLAEFVADIAPAIHSTYGARAAQQYRNVARAGISQTISRPDVRAWSIGEGGSAWAMLFARRDANREVIFFFHELASRNRTGAGAALLAYVLSHLARTTDAVYTEYLPFGSIAADAHYAQHGFQCVQRQIMRRTLAPADLCDVPDFEIRYAASEEYDALARVLSSTYDGNRERHLYPEVQSVACAREYVRGVAGGQFGSCAPEFLIGAWRGQACAAVILGSEVLSGLGFVLHIAVLPEFQRRGIGRSLLRDLCEVFQNHGLGYAALGVTCDNPAVTLYERMGFSPVVRVPVYFRR